MKDPEDGPGDVGKPPGNPIEAEETTGTSDATKIQVVSDTMREIQAGPSALEKNDPPMINTFSNALNSPIDEWLNYMD
jgi:hypothetical protein